MVFEAPMRGTTNGGSMSVDDSRNEMTTTLEFRGTRLGAVLSLLFDYLY
jgi:hypothetical protein